MMFVINLSLFFFVCYCYSFEIQVYYAQLFPFISVEPSLKIQSQSDGEYSKNIEKKVFNLVRVKKNVAMHKRRCQSNKQLEFSWTQVFVLRICSNSQVLPGQMLSNFDTGIPGSPLWNSWDKKNVWQYFAFSSLKMRKGVWCNIQEEEGEEEDRTNIAT